MNKNRGPDWVAFLRVKGMAIGGSIATGMLIWTVTPRIVWAFMPRDTGLGAFTGLAVGTVLGVLAVMGVYRWLDNDKSRE